MTTASMVDLVRASLNRDGLTLNDKHGQPLDPLREAFVLTELVELIDDAQAASEWGVAEIEAFTPDSWDQQVTKQFVVDRQLLDQCRAA